MKVVLAIGFLLLFLGIGLVYCDISKLLSGLLILCGIGMAYISMRIKEW